MSTRSNLITQEEMAAINGPVAREDGTLVCVNNLSTGWQYSIENPNFEMQRGSIHPTSQLARDELIPLLPAQEQELWKQPHNDLAPGTPWFGQRVGQVNVSTEAVFVRAAYTQNNTLTQQSMPRIQRPNGYDLAGNSLTHYAARVGNVTYLEEFLKQKTVKRSNVAGNSPSHFAATSPHDTLGKLVVLNQQAFPIMSKNNQGVSAMDMLDKTQVLELLPQLKHTKTSFSTSPLLKNKVIVPQRQQDKDRKIER